jgi:hypothetical protein
MGAGILDGTALGHWVELALPEPPWQTTSAFVGFAYLDPDAGMSAKGGASDDPEIARAPSLTVRIPIGVPSRVLRDDEVAARRLPVVPAWIDQFGPQPRTDAPWRRDPILAGRWHKQFPDDIAVLVADDASDRTTRKPEVCWVRVDGDQVAPPRAITAGDGSVLTRSAVVYQGVLLSAPRQLTSVGAGARLLVIPDPGGRHPLAVSARYLAERGDWTIAACRRCGLGECFAPPSLILAAAVDDNRPRTVPCSACGALSTLTLTRLAPAT